MLSFNGLRIASSPGTSTPTKTPRNNHLLLALVDKLDHRATKAAWQIFFALTGARSFPTVFAKLILVPHFGRGISTEHMSVCLDVYA